MEITIEQHRARIGSYNNKVKLKCFQFSTRIHHTCDIIMLLLLVVKLLGLSLLIYFAVETDMLSFNETRKRFTEYQNFGKVVTLFYQGQISGDHAFVTLLLRLSNNVEENPGPTIYDVVDPTKTICAVFHQGDARKFHQNAGKQCVSMSLVAIIHNQCKKTDFWDS